MNILCPRACSSRRESRRQDRRDAILTVATRSFFERGYAGTTMSAIAATLGGSKGTLWRYFPSKEELFSAVIDREVATYRARLSEILNPCGDLRQTLRTYATNFLEKLNSPQAVALYRLVAGEAGRFPEMGAIFYDRAPRQNLQLLADFLEDAMARGLLRRDNTLDAARSLVGLCMSGCHTRVIMGLVPSASESEIAEDVDRAVETFLRAFAPEQDVPLTAS